MTSAVRMTLALGPLAAYFILLGLWQLGRRARIVPGVVDFALLVFGTGGLLAFGPFGAWLVGLLFPNPSLWAWLAEASSLGLLALLWAPRTARRLVVYNVDSAALSSAVFDTFVQMPGTYSPTVRGFEDTSRGQGVTIEFALRSRVGVIEAYGDHPDAMIVALTRALRTRLRDDQPRRLRIALVWFGLSAVTLILGPLLWTMMGRSVQVLPFAR